MVSIITFVENATPETTRELINERDDKEEFHLWLNVSDS